MRGGEQRERKGERRKSRLFRIGWSEAFQKSSKKLGLKTRVFKSRVFFSKSGPYQSRFRAQTINYDRKIDFNLIRYNVDQSYTLLMRAVKLTWRSSQLASNELPKSRRRLVPWNVIFFECPVYISRTTPDLTKSIFETKWEINTKNRKTCSSKHCDCDPLHVTNTYWYWMSANDQNQNLPVACEMMLWKRAHLALTVFSG